MKHLIVLSAILFLFRPVFPVVEYAMNYDYVVNVLCVNKAKPELKCNGKCHLMKALAKAAENEKPISENNKKQFSLELFCNTSSTVLFPEAFPLFKARSGMTYRNGYAFVSQYEFFHPPTLI